MYLATGNKFILTTPVAQWLFHKHDPRGCVVPEVGVLFNQPYIPRGVVVTNTYGLYVCYIDIAAVPFALAQIKIQLPCT